MFLLCSVKRSRAPRDIAGGRRIDGGKNESVRFCTRAWVRTCSGAVVGANANAGDCGSRRQVGQTVTVEGVVSEVHTAASGRATFIDIGGRYPNNTFTAVIFSRDVTKFSNVDALNGKTVDITGPVRLHNGKPEIILNDPGQLKAK